MTNRNMKISVALLSVFVLVLAGAVIVSGDDAATTASPPPTGASSSTGETDEDLAEPVVVRTSDARRLGPKGDSGVTFTEFLDFECEACLAAFPLIEDLREKYKGSVTFNLRYFPLPGHGNSENAAVAVEASAQQGKLEEMYMKMYETQTEWSEQQVSKADVFRGFAEDLGLDMEEYDAAVADPATLERVREDVSAARALGLQGTPSFFVNEKPIDPQTPDDLSKEIENALSSK